MWFGVTLVSSFTPFFLLRLAPLFLLHLTTFLHLHLALLAGLLHLLLALRLRGAPSLSGLRIALLPQRALLRVGQHGPLAGVS